MWSHKHSSPHEHERTKHWELLRELENQMSGVLSCTVPVDFKAWLVSEADRREIPVSWMVTEILKLGIETHKIINGG